MYCDLNDHARSFSPLSLSPALWLDAADLSSITTVSGNVSQWADKSGNNRHATQATSGNRPVYSATGLNSLPCLTFNGSSQALACPASSTNAIVGNGSNVSVILVLTAASGGYSAFGNIGSDENNRFQAHIKWNDGQIYFDAGNAGTARMTANTSTASPCIICLTRQGANGSIRNTGSVVTSSSTLSGSCSFTSETFNVGAQMGPIGSNYFNGTIAEMIVLNGSVTTASIERLEGYLARKWGLLASLPTGHTYKTQAP